jgi:hypothetical protein
MTTLRNTSPQRIAEPGVGTLELWPVPTTEHLLCEILRDLFEYHWQDITFGPLLQGAAWELRTDCPPHNVVLHDGYLTIDFGRMHVHLCIGAHRGDPDCPTDPTLARQRRTARAEFFRRVNRDGTPDTWGFRMFNGQGDQQITILFPNPFVSEEQQFYDTPRWERLKLWDQIRKRYLELESEIFDRSGRRMLYP